MPRSTDIADLLHCPACAGSELLPAPAAWHCPACGASYPELDGVPVLVADPAFVLGEWRLR